jgi:hypothetical protein
MIWPTTEPTAVATADRGAAQLAEVGRAMPAASAIALAAPLPRTNILLARLTAATRLSAPKSAIAAALLATAIFATGCKGTGGAGGSAGGVAAAVGSSADPATLGKLIKSGGAPLNYRISPAGTLRVLDTTDNNTLLVSTAVPASTIVNIDQTRGISFNGQVVKAGPLAPQHRYAIYLQQ